MIRSLIPCLFLLLAASCSNQNDTDSAETIEARDWLRNNPNQLAFASNRFGEKENAAKLVDHLYELGCENVRVSNILSEQWRIESEGGPYADTLIARLPEDLQKRIEIFSIHARESPSQGLETENDSGQAELIFWWD